LADLLVGVGRRPEAYSKVRADSREIAGLTAPGIDQFATPRHTRPFEDTGGVSQGATSFLRMA
jgi:hypothetical protein